MIEQLHITAYGKLADRDIPLREGINLLYGPNEAGKSTVTSFLRAMLYGMPVTRARGIGQNDRKRCRPWAGEQFGGALLYRTRKGRRLAVQRSFRATAARDTLRVVDAQTGTEAAELCPNLGENLFGITAETFESTAFLRQGDARVTRTDELVNRIHNLVSSASEEVGYSASLKNLKGLKDQLRKERGKNGELDLLEQKQRELEAQRRGLEEDYQGVLARMERLTQVETQLASQQQKLEESKNARQYQEYKKAAEDYGRILQLRLDVKNLSGQIEATRKTITVGEYVPDRACVDAMTTAWEHLENSTQSCEELKQELEGLKNQEAQLAEDPLCRWPDLETDAQRAKECRERMGVMDASRQARQPLMGQRDRLRDQLAASRSPETAFLDRDSDRARAEELLKKGSSGGKSLLWPVAGVLAALAVAGWLWDWKAGLAVLAALAVWLVVAGGGQGRRGKGSREFLRRVGAADLQQLESLYRRWQEENILRRSTEQQLRQIEATLEQENMEPMDQERQQLERELAGLLRKYRCQEENQLRELARQAGEKMLRLGMIKEEIARRRAQLEKKLALQKADREQWDRLAARALPQGLSLEAQRRELANLAKHVRRLEEKGLQLEEKQGFLDRLTQGQDEETLKEGYLRYRELESSGVRYEGDTPQDNTRQVMELAQEKSSLEAQIGAYFAGEEAVEQVLQQLEENRQELERGQKRYNALCLAYDTLALAMEEMSRDFAPHLTRAVGANLALLTDGKYDTLLIDKDYDIRVCGPDSPGGRELEYFSAGTVDQIYLAFRLALVDIISGEEPLPLILDDCFCHYDDRRLEAAMEMLAKISGKYQILLLTCQNREENFLKKIANYHKVVV